MKELLEAGVHFGHQTKRWNPKMKEYIFGERNGIYIIDLQKTLKLFKDAMRYVAEAAGAGGNLGRSHALRPILCQSALAGRLAHQHADRAKIHQAAERTGCHGG